MAGRNHLDQTHPYIIEFVASEGFKLPAEHDHDRVTITAELHCSFFYHHVVKDEMFFYGRTCKSSPIEMAKHKDGTMGFRNNEPLFFHSSIKLKPNETNVKYFLVVELVIVNECFKMHKNSNA